MFVFLFCLGVGSYSSNDEFKYPCCIVCIPSAVNSDHKCMEQNRKKRNIHKITIKMEKLSFVKHKQNLGLTLDTQITQITITFQQHKYCTHRCFISNNECVINKPNFKCHVIYSSKLYLSFSYMIEKQEDK